MNPNDISLLGLCSVPISSGALVGYGLSKAVNLDTKSSVKSGAAIGVIVDIIVTVSVVKTLQTIFG